MATSIYKQMMSRCLQRTLLRCSRKKHSLRLERKLSSFQIFIDEYGDPKDSLKSRTTNLTSSLDSRQVLIKMMMSPINPSDVNMIEGTYFVKPPLPTVLGNEGVGKVMDVGKGVKGLSEGDWVLPANAAAGTWQSLRVATDEQLIKIPNDMPMVSAATLSVNPCSAYRMLKDYSDLKPGDVIIQNGANSGVGVSVIQLAKEWNIKTVNIVRNRPDLDSLIEYLKSLGADYVVTEDFLRKPDMRALMKDIGVKPKLALNCVGGQCATELIRHLEQDGVMVTYGAMSRRPIVVPTGPLIFKQVKLFGFWNTLWNENSENEFSRIEMLADLSDLIKKGKFVAPKHELYALEEYKTAIKQATEGYKGGKVIFKID